MFGAIAKTYYAQKAGINPKDIVVVSIMPCTAKKFEVTRDMNAAKTGKDVDFALTTRELARMIKKAGIDFNALADEDFDTPLGLSTGAAVIFGATGGVMEAALRTAVEELTGEKLGNLDFMEVRGIEGVKEATYSVAGLDVKVAVASGLSNAKALMDKVKAGEGGYHFIEIMGCPGGCVNGGGQPLQSAKVRNSIDLRSARAKALYGNDTAKTVRKSHENEGIKELYKDFLEKPGSHKAHELLHTTYTKRKVHE
jgi:NADP-reducing hydrogenase subunit HndD